MFAATTTPLDALHRIKLVVPVVLLALFWCWETWRPFFGPREGRVRHAGHNLAIALFNTVILGLAFGFVTAMVAGWTEENQYGVLNALGLDGAARFVLAAEDHVARRFPNNKVKRVGSGMRAAAVAGFLFGLKLLFQPGKADGLNAVYHFTFTGKEPKEATVTIRDGTVQVQDGRQAEGWRSMMSPLATGARPFTPYPGQESREPVSS